MLRRPTPRTLVATSVSLALMFSQFPSANALGSSSARPIAANLAPVAPVSPQTETGCTTPTHGFGSMATAEAVAIMEETNRVRIAHGLCPLAWSEELAVSAQGWAHHLVRTGRFEHPTHGNFAENLFLSNQYNNPNARDAVERWMNSEGHRRNLLDPRVKTIGVSITKHEGRMSGGILYVQRFR